ncbi:MAG: metallophosphoesterase [Bryobacteraceae bacterium]
MVEPVWRYVPELLGGTLSIAVQWAIVRILGRKWPRAAWPLAAAAVLTSLWVAFSFGFSIPWFYNRWPVNGLLAWVKAGGILWGMVTVWGMAVHAAWVVGARLRRLGGGTFDPVRRRALEMATRTAIAAPAAVLGYGAFVERRNFRIKEIEIPVKGLAPDLNGLRMVQITDIHLSPFFSASDLEYAVGMANETKAHLALMTGDLISVRGDPLEQCVRILEKVKADAGMIGCLGNHEISADCEDLATRLAARRGIRILRGQAERVRFGNADINFAGVDYQRRSWPYLTGAETMLRPDVLNVLLSHNPDVFPVAAGMGYDLTISGHTHGGQVTVEILHQYANIIRFFTPYVYGHYEKDGKSIYVSRGLGTVGIPVRVGAPPEVSLIRLCAT